MFYANNTIGATHRQRENENHRRYVQQKRTNDERHTEGVSTPRKNDDEMNQSNLSTASTCFAGNLAADSNDLKMRRDALSVRTTECMEKWVSLEGIEPTKENITIRSDFDEIVEIIAQDLNDWEAEALAFASTFEIVEVTLKMRKKVSNHALRQRHKMSVLRTLYNPDDETSIPRAPFPGLAQRAIRTAVSTADQSALDQSTAAATGVDPAALSKKLDDVNNPAPPHRHGTRSSVRNAIRGAADALRSLTGSPTGTKIDRRPSLDKTTAKQKTPNPTHREKARRTSEPALPLDLVQDQTEQATTEKVVNQTEGAAKTSPPLLDKRPPTGRKQHQNKTGQPGGATEGAEIVVNEGLGRQEPNQIDEADEEVKGQIEKMQRKMNETDERTKKMQKKFEQSEAEKARLVEREEKSKREKEEDEKKMQEEKEKNGARSEKARKKAKARANQLAAEKIEKMKKELAQKEELEERIKEKTNEAMRRSTEATQWLKAYEKEKKEREGEFHRVTKANRTSHSPPKPLSMSSTPRPQKRASTEKEKETTPNRGYQIPPGVRNEEYDDQGRERPGADVLSETQFEGDLMSQGEKRRKEDDFFNDAAIPEEMRDEAREAEARREEQKKLHGTRRWLQAVLKDPEEKIIAPKKLSTEDIRRERLARERVRELRPKSDEERMTIEEPRDYASFKLKFNRMTNIDGLTDEEKLGELIEWTAGTARRMIEPHVGAYDPVEALELAWEALDLMFAAKIQSPREKLEPTFKKGQLTESSISSHFDVLADLQVIYEEAKRSKTHMEFNRLEIVRETVEKKLAIYKHKFWENQSQKKKVSPSSEILFTDIIAFVADKAHMSALMGSVVTEKKAPQQRININSTETQQLSPQTGSDNHAG